MTYLELCVLTRQLAAIQGTGPTTVISQTGEYLRLVEWVANAWTRIQGERSGKWKFLATEWTRNTIASTGDYEYSTADNIRTFDLDSFHIYLTADGANTRTKLQYMEYKKFKRAFTDFSSEDKPFIVTIQPNNELRLFPTPDAVYTMEADAFTHPVVLAADADVPAIPADLHQIIVYRALRDYASYEDAVQQLQFNDEEYKRLFNQMLWTQLYEEEDMVVRPQ